jgi:hypothetical protein
MKKKELVSDIKLGLAQYSDDGNIPSRQVCFWINQARAHFMELMDLDEEDLAQIKKKSCLKVEKDDQKCSKACAQYVINLPYPMTHVRVYRANGKTTDMEQAESQAHFDMLCDSRWATCVIWWRCGDKIYFNDKIPQDFEVLVEHIAVNIEDCDDDDCVVIPHMALTITQEAKRIGMTQLNVPLDSNNDGRDDKR